MFNIEVCKKCYLENGWNIEPIIDGRWGLGIFCPKSRRWLEHWKKEVPEGCQYQMEHLILEQEENCFE